MKSPIQQTNTKDIDPSDLPLSQRSEIIMSRLFPDDECGDAVLRLFLDYKLNEGKLYLPLCRTLAELVNKPVGFHLCVEVRADKTVIHF